MNGFLLLTLANVLWRYCNYQCKHQHCNDLIRKIFEPFQLLASGL